MNKRTNVWLDDKDRAAIKEIRKRYGLPTDAAAIRLALRILAASDHLTVDIDALSKRLEEEDEK